MSLPNAIPSTSTNQFPVAPVSPGQPTNGNGPFVDRRREGGAQGASERRQFGSSHEGLSEGGRELALAIDQYKLQHHRRYITCDEMLFVITSLGYTK